MNLIAASSSRIACRAFGHGCSCCRSYLNWATLSLSCCVNSRWSSCTGTITSPSYCTPGSRIRSIPRPRDGTSWWTTASTRSCTPTTLSRQCGTGHLKQSPWWSPRYSSARWWSAVPSTYPPINIWRAAKWTATLLAWISVLASRCTSAILSYSRDSSTRRTWPERRSTRSTLLTAHLVTSAITISSKPTKAVISTPRRPGVFFFFYLSAVLFLFLLSSVFFFSLFLFHAAGRRSHISRIYLY